MLDANSTALVRLREWTERLLPKHRRPRPKQALYDEILYLSSQTQSLDALLTQYPERICTALDLRNFHILLREGSRYVLQTTSPTAKPVALLASSSTVSRMRRDRRPAVVADPQHPGLDREGWQLLAEPLELEALASLEAQLLIPLQGRTGLMGFAALSRRNLQSFTSAELRFLSDLGPQMGRGLETAQMIGHISHQAVEQARAHRELELAREVQSHLLPGRLPTVPGVEAAAAYRSAEQVGGDYYDLFVTSAGHLCAVVADVSGKGVPAALLMSSLRASVHALLLADTPITLIAERLNLLLYEASSTNRYATLFLCLYDSVENQLTYCNAGHNPPMLLRANGTMRHLNVGGMVVGLLPGAVFASETLTFEPGDLLLAYTDGVSEANNVNSEEWGEARLEQALRFASAQTLPQPVLDSVLAALGFFVGDQPQNDDITLLLLQRKP